MRAALLRFLHVPPTPEPPPGSPPSVFRASPSFFTLRILRWGITRGVALVGLVWAIYFVQFLATTKAPMPFVRLMQAFEIFAWVAFLLEFFCGWMIVRLDYELRWYMVSDRAIRIREGITTIREKTIALANIQNISVRQGPLQRFLGIADVEVKTAGGGGEASEPKKKHAASEPMHVAYFRGVDNAAAIRDLLREGVRRQRDTGLGDPDDHVHHDVHSAAQELLTEARALRQLRRA